MNEKKESPMSALWKWGKDYHGKFIASIVLAALGVACQMIPYFCVARLVAMMLRGEKETSGYVILCLVALAGYLGRALFSTYPQQFPIQLHTILCGICDKALSENCRKYRWEQY